MKISTRSVLTASMAVMSAGVLSFAQSVQPPPPPRPAPTVHLAAYVQPLVLKPHVVALDDTPPPVAAPLAIPIAPNLANSIDNIYLAVEPWVEYGFAVAASVVAWIPYVGWASGFIMDGYFFGESLVASAVFNFTDWLRGDGGIVENVVDFGIDVGLAFVWLGLDVVNTFIPLPPCNCYPPRPPVQGPFLAADTMVATVDTETAKASDGGEVEQSGADQGEGQTSGVDLTAEESEQGTTEDDTTGEDTVEVAANGDGSEGEGDVQSEAGEDVDISALAQEDATAGSTADSVGADATTDSSGTVEAPSEVHESADTEPTDTEPTDTATEVQSADGSAGAQAADDQTATTQTPSTDDTESNGTGDD